MKSLGVLNSQNAVNATGNVRARRVLEATTARSHYVDHWQMGRTDRHEKDGTAIVRKGGRVSTAMSALRTMRAIV